ncbi:MAG TPA: hypothetical protein DD435_00765 [Cyanobacteria bacterium UBA8530]|nr:hypothetical protein [Cyanobacteria bacterium UBA8530]
MQDLAIVVVNYNRADFLGRCLEAARSELEFSAIEGSIVVVDNASADDSVFVAKKTAGVVVLENRENLGFAAGCNQGGKVSRSRYVLLLNNDVIINEGALGKLVSFADRHPRLAAVGARLLTPSGQEQLPPMGLLAKTVNRFGKPQYLKWLPGACLLLRREALDRIGWLDAGFFFYNEDLDLGLRLRRDGWKIAYLPAASVVHHEGKSSDLVRPLAILEGYRGGLRLTAKHYGKTALFFARLGMKAEIFFRTRGIERKKEAGKTLGPKEVAWQEIAPRLKELVESYAFNSDSGLNI